MENVKNRKGQGEIYCMRSSHGRPTPVNETRFDILVESLLKHNLHIETPPACDCPTETPPAYDVPESQTDAGNLKGLKEDEVLRSPLPVPVGHSRDRCLQEMGMMEGLTHYYKSTFKMPPPSEDCLYLNIYTPNDREKESKLPVMVFIHGGGLIIGGAYYDGSALSVYENVVVVSIQYRLGILGFFSTGDDKLPGNLGFIDQVAALHWVQENIADFGGDQHSVTIFGESAGGVSVSALVLSPLAKGLFHKAISESGFVTMSSLVVSKPEDLTIYQDLVAGLFGCSVSSVVECLKLKSEEDILSVAAKMVRHIPGCHFGYRRKIC
ncbi:hypothetical protein AB205_0056290 [Aquarana catesbeiana]|uniref:Carboxylic ester hydrolase n=1 Tax=Aquarana catesbeiana TaxID=8400 RepID=A0A2G9SKJ5_AQUCT|nr:hypothetical protein AB205_0056290 [Aquarana catesbeiana]